MPAITRDPRTGLPLLYRDSQYASRGFKIDNNTFTATALIPKPKFLFFVKFVSELTQVVTDNNAIIDFDRYSNTKDGITFQVKSIDRPKFNVNTETLQQYNKKRIIQTKINYQPMTITFHDDVSDRVISFWKEYYSFYYGDARQTTSKNWTNDIVTTDFNEGSGNVGWGYLGDFESTRPNRMHFLERIELLQFYGQSYTTIQFIHPKITMIDHDANDYSDGATGSGIVMQFEYEGVIYGSENTAGELQRESVGTGEEYGFDEATFKETGNIFSTIPTEGGQRRVRNARNDITSVLQDILPTRRSGSFGAAAITNRIITDVTRQVSAGNRVLSGSGFTFGTGALGGLTSNVRSLVTATSLTGNVPSPDLSQKETGVRTTINNFGDFGGRTTGDILTDPRTVNNTGIDITKVAKAASIINSNAVSSEQNIGGGQSVFVDSSQLNKFSRSFGTAAALAKNQGIVTDVADYPNSVTPTSAEADVVVNKLPNGNYQVTEKGAAVMNSLRTPNSAIGVRRPQNPWTNPDSVNSSRRNLNAETNVDNPLDP